MASYGKETYSEQNGSNDDEICRCTCNEQTADSLSMPSTSRNVTGEMCVCDEFCDFYSNFSPSIMQNFKNSELNNTLFHPDEYGHEDMPTNQELFLFEDSYEPGLIEDSVECRKDFNAVSFGIFFESIQHIPKALPPKTPMSLLEAFQKRIDYERKKLLDATNLRKNDRKLTVQSVQTFFSHKPKTNLNTALSNLYKAEALFDSSGNQAIGNEAYDVEIRKNTQPLVGGCPIAVEAFVGITTPKSKQKAPKKR